LETAQDPQAVIDEIYRVLKPGGKVLAVCPAWFDVDFWQRCVFFWKRWLGRKPSALDEATHFTVRGLKKHFGRFADNRVHNDNCGARTCRTSGAGYRCPCWSG